MKHTDMIKGRRRIELSPSGDDTSFAFRIVDSLCNSEEEIQRERNPVMYVSSDLNFLEASISSPSLESSCLADDFIEICLSSDKVVKRSVETAGADKSPTGMVKALHSPSSSVSNMFDPFMKPKSLQSPARRNKTYRKSLLRDFLNAGYESHVVKKHDLPSPFHLHGCLKFGTKHGVPLFEFSMNEPEDVFRAKALKADKGFNWVYTFHSVCNKKKSKDATSIVAQMQVSSRLCSGGDVVDNSLVTEFVLYDIARAHSAPSWSSPGSGVRRYKSDGGSNVVRLKDFLNHAAGSVEVEFLKGPSPADMHPTLEIVAIVIQVPFKNRENLKYRRGEKIDDKRHLNLLNVSTIEESKGKIQDSRSQEKVNVVIPIGNHSFPCAESSRGPSSLLDRWRMGGGCDCGGWDMACPLVVLGNPCLNRFEDQPLVDSEQPFRLFIQGAKENTPALTMTAIEGGYAVDFHAKLSALQAFSICVAILHCTETSSAATETESKHLSRYDSLKMLIEEEVKFLIKSVTETEDEEEKKNKISKKVEAIPSSYAINPPFSPIGRV